MFDKHYIGLDLTGFENNGTLSEVSRITLLVDDENVVTAGDDTGMELVSNCPHATQAMAEALLTSLKGYQYRMYGADSANIDPAAELGDGVTAGGVYSIISSIEDDGSGYMCVAAPGEAEEADEFPGAGPMTKEFRRKLADVRSSITKTADQILLKVESEIDDMSAYIDLKLDSITSQVSGLNGEVSKLSQQVGNITLSVSNNESSSTIRILVDGVAVSSQTIRFTGDVVFASDLASGETVVSGNCISTGKIATDYLHLGGEMYIYSGSSTDITNYGGSFGYYQGWMYDANGNLQTTNGVGIRYSSTRGQLNCTSGGVWCGYGSRAGLSAYSSGVTIKGSTIHFDGAVDFSTSSVSGLDALDGSYVSVKGNNDVTLSLADGTIAVKLDKNNGRIKFWVDGTAWYLDSSGLHQ